MTNAPISRATLFWRDEIRRAEKEHRASHDRWRIVAVKGCSNAEDRRILKEVTYDMKMAEKGLKNAWDQFKKAAFEDLELVE